MNDEIRLLQGSIGGLVLAITLLSDRKENEQAVHILREHLDKLEMKLGHLIELDSYNAF